MTDAVAANRTPKGDKRGQQVVKFSADGKVLLRLGTPGTPGAGPDHFNSPSDVVVAPNGDVFVADGHNENGNNRIVKFSKDGKFVKEWGKTGYAPSEFRAIHAIAMDSRGRIFVGDRANNRIQLFDQEGKFLTQWTQFGRPSGIAFDGNDRIFVADSESDDVQNPGWEMGIRIGEAKTGWVTEFIQFPWGDPRSTAGNGAEFVAVDRDGNIYGGEPAPEAAAEVRQGEALTNSKPRKRKRRPATKTRKHEIDTMRFRVFALSWLACFFVLSWRVVCSAATAVAAACGSPLRFPDAGAG